MRIRLRQGGAPVKLAIMQGSFSIWLGNPGSNFFPAHSAADATHPKKRQVPRLAALVVAAAMWFSISSSLQAAPQVLKGHVPKATRQLQPVDRLDSGRRLELAIGLPLRNGDKLTNLLEDLSQPSSAHFRHFLTADEFASSFGPSAEDYQKVIDFAKSHGLVVKGTHPNRTLLDVSGSVEDIENAFHVTMRVYQHPTEARTFFAPDVEPSLDLATPVLAISGLDNYKTPKPRGLGNSPGAGITLPKPDVRILGGGGSGPAGNGGENTYLGYDFRNAYAPGVALDGTGQYVALFELTGYDPDDISDYEGEAGLPSVPLQNTLIDGFDGNDTNYDYAIEATADIEMAIAMAPGLSGVLVYEGPTPLDVAPLGTNYVQDPVTTAQINDVFNQIATDNLASQISCSYEMDINLSTVQIFQQFAVQGQSMFTGSGDSGAYPASIDEPADDPYLTVVGGTTLSTSSSGAWTSETVWLTPASQDPLFGNTPEAASGGGISLAYPMPVWQQGISMTANKGSTTMRNLPDVAMVANNVDVVWGNDLIGESIDLPEAGTSLATPLWASFMALVNQQAAANGQPRVGFANPALYAIGKSSRYSACFHDVKTGNNYTPSNPSRFAAVAGYDLCTGWGSPTGSNLINAILAPPVENLLVTPPIGFASFGPGQGPFSVTSQAFTLSNIGDSPLNWSLVNTSSWLAVTASSGTLQPGGVSTVTVSLSSAANDLLIGSPSGNITILDQTSDTVQNREFDLYVGNGGFETGDLTDWTLNGDPALVFALAGDDVDVAGTNALQDVPDWDFVHSGIYGGYLGQFDWNGEPPEGSLSQTVATTPGRQYLVSFWFTSVASDGSTTPNNFAAIWDGSILFAQTNMDAVAWTNMQFVVHATSASATLEFDFYNVPAAFGLDDVSVETVPAPVLEAVTHAAGAINFSWSSLANALYQVQVTSNLNHPQWANVGSAIAGTGGVVSASETISAGSPEYYRVALSVGP